MMAKKTKIEIDDQPQLPAMEDEKIPELISAAKRFYRNRRLLKDAASDLQASADAVLKIMHERNIPTYNYKGLEVTIAQMEKLKVKVGDASKNGDGE